jgi:transglutaminase-like putative cysteine protease
MDAVRGKLVYEPGATDVQTRADEVLALGRGVCQDFAHVLLAACRSVRIPARYVSGYLYDQTLEGDNAASHAWVDIWDEGRGWLALDPTHDRQQSESYVRVAVGRDYGDVPPTRGVYKGGASETLSVRVRLQAL